MIGSHRPKLASFFNTFSASIALVNRKVSVNLLIFLSLAVMYKLCAITVDY